MNVDVANRLFDLRKEHHLSQEELADRIGVSRQAVSKWERAEASPDTDNLVLLARLYRVSLDALLATDGPLTGGALNMPVNPADDSGISMRQPDETATRVRRRFVVNPYVFPLPLISIFLFLVLGFVFQAWHPGWLVLLLIPIYYTTIVSFRWVHEKQE